MKIEHIAMYVNELETARDFFVKYLGCESNDGYHNEKTGFRSFFIRFEDGARLEIMNKPSMEDIEKPVNRTGYIHIAFSVGSVEDNLCVFFEIDLSLNIKNICEFLVFSYTIKPSSTYVDVLLGNNNVKLKEFDKLSLSVKLSKIY